MTLPVVASSTLALPALVDAAGDRARTRFLEFFAVSIRNPNTRRAYGHAAADFLGWCAAQGVSQLGAIGPIHVAAWIELMGRELAAPTVKQRLAGIRSLFDWLVVGQIVPHNPAASVRGPSYSTKRGKTPALIADEMAELIRHIDVSTPIGLRDRALIGLMVYTFARVGAATAMAVEDAYVQGRRLWVRLHEKGGKLHEMPCHHRLEEWLVAYMEGGDLLDSPRVPLFQTIARGTGKLSGRAMPQQSVYDMIQRRAQAAGIRTRLGAHSFRATGITIFRAAGGTLDQAQHMANHASPRTTQLYDRRQDEITLDEVERIRF
jgi:site-specific recombinase XerD